MSDENRKLWHAVRELAGGQEIAWALQQRHIEERSYRWLAKRLGITEPAIYRHFENKIQILIALLDLLKKNTSTLFDAELNSNKPAIKKIERLFERHFEMFAEIPSLASVIFSEEIFRNEDQLIAKISEVIEHNNQKLLTILKEGQKKKEIRGDIEVSHLVIFIMGALRLFVKKWQFSGFSFDLEKEGAKLILSVRQLMVKQ